MIIGLNGRLRSGKDTTFHLINEMYGDEFKIQQVSFAAKLKDSAAASIGVTRAVLEELKNDEDLYFILYRRKKLQTSNVQEDRAVRFNVREYLQWYGTEGHREIFGDDFWVDQALPLDKDYSDGLYVVTDMRFPNEVQRVKDLNGLCVKVERESATAHGEHASEQNLDHMIDYVLDNTGSLDDLRNHIAEMFDLTIATNGRVLNAITG